MQHPVLAEVPSDTRTAVYSALLNETGNLVAAVADMDCFHSITPEFIERYEAAAHTLRSSTTVLTVASGKQVVVPLCRCRPEHVPNGAPAARGDDFTLSLL